MSTRFFKLFLISSFLISLAACDFSESEESSPRLGALTMDEISYKLIPLNEANSYAVDISWRKTDSKVSIKKESEENFTVFETERNSARYLAGGGERFFAYVEIRNPEGRLDSAKEISVNIPRDWVIEGVEEIQSDRTVQCGRLFLKENAILRTLNFHLKVFCQELISERGTIETFARGSVAMEPGVKGRSGGDVQLSFQKARGIIVINLRGEAGAAGRNGLRGFATTRSGYFPGCQGQDGGRGGGTGSILFLLKESSQLEISGEVVAGLGGDFGRMNAEYMDDQAIRPPKTNDPPIFAPCVVGGGNGVPGVQGPVGSACVQDPSQSAQQCLSQSSVNL